MKKILIFVLVAVMLTALAVPAMAAGSASLSVSNSTVHRGDTFTVTVSLSGVKNCSYGGLEITFGSAFELIDGECLLENVGMDYFVVADKEGGFAFDKPRDLSGKIFRLTFKVKNDAKLNAKDTISVKVRVNSEATDLQKSASVTVACDHKYGSWNVASDTSKHTRKCNTCGNVETKSHTYDNDCDTTCNDCSATRTITHAFGTDWIGDETGHWHACATCGEKSEFGEHVPGAPAGEYTDQICTVCNYVLASALGHQHKYGETFETDAGGHWTKCLGCGEETAHVPHSFGSDCDTACDECGYERLVQHKVSDTWTGSAQAHWKVCSECSARLEQSDHIWDGGTVIEEAGWNKPGKISYHCGLCKTERTDEIPALTVMEALPWWGWMVIGAVGGVIVTVGVGLAIILPGSLNKKKGRFSN